MQCWKERKHFNSVEFNPNKRACGNEGDESDPFSKSIVHVTLVHVKMDHVKSV